MLIAALKRRVRLRPNRRVSHDLPLPVGRINAGFRRVQCALSLSLSLSSAVFTSFSFGSRASYSPAVRGTRFFYLAAFLRHVRARSPRCKPPLRPFFHATISKNVAQKRGLVLGARKGAIEDRESLFRTRSLMREIFSSDGFPRPRVALGELFIALCLQCLNLNLDLNGY